MTIATTALFSVFSITNAAATSATLVGRIISPPAGSGPLGVTTSTHILLNGWRKGDVRLGLANSSYWIDINENGTYDVSEDTALTSVGLYVAGVLVAGGSTALYGPPIPSYFTGWEDRTSSTLSWDNATSVFSIAPVGSDAFYWQDQTSYSLTAETTVSLTGGGGNYWIYFDSGTLTYIKNPTHAQSDDLITKRVLVGMVEWNENYSDTIILSDERHGVQMSGETHHWLHEIVGAVWSEGGGLSGYTLNTDSDAGVSFNITDVDSYDEDIIHEVVDGTSATQYAQVLTGDAEIPVLYRDDITGDWVQDEATSMAYKTTGTGRLAYNNDDGDGTWSQVEVTNNRYMLYTLIMTNDWEYPIKMVQGVGEHITQAGAEAAVSDEQVAWGTLPAEEFYVMYVFVMQTGSGFGGQTKSKIISITDYRSEAAVGGGGGVSDHGNLGGLDDPDDHTTIYLRLDGVNTPSATINWADQGLTSVGLFQVNGAGTTPVLYSNPDGSYPDRVGMGTTTPSASLHIFSSESNQFRLQKSGAGTSSRMEFIDGDLNLSYFAGLAGNFYASAPSGGTIFFQQNSVDKFRVYGTYVDVPAGSLYAHGTIYAYADYYVNYDGPDANSYIYFYENSSASGENIAWVDSVDVFRISDELWLEGFLGVNTYTPASPINTYEDNASTDSSIGITIEQDGAGDSVIQFLLTGGQRWVAGIDNSDADSFKISPSAGVGTGAAFIIETDSDVYVTDGLYLGDALVAPSAGQVVTGVNGLVIYQSSIGIQRGSGGYMDLYAPGIAGNHSFVFRSSDAGGTAYLGQFWNSTTGKYARIVPDGGILSTGEADFTGTNASEFGGAIRLDGTYLSINYDGADGTQSIYFYEDGGWTGESIEWDDGSDEFQFSDDVDIAGYLTVSYFDDLVDVGDGSTTGSNAVSIMFDSSHFSVSDDGSSKVTVSFTGEQTGAYTVTTTSVDLKHIIYEETLTADGIFDVDVPSGYDRIYIHGVLRGDVSATIDNVELDFNDDTTDLNYIRIIHYFGDSTGGTPEVSDNYVGSVAGDTAATNSFTNMYILIEGPDLAKFHQAHARSMERQSAGVTLGRHSMIEWETAEALTSLTLRPDGYPTQNFKYGSKITIYGEKSTDVVTDVTGLYGPSTCTKMIDAMGAYSEHASDHSDLTMTSATAITYTDAGPGASSATAYFDFSIPSTEHNRAVIIDEITIYLEADGSGDGIGNVWLMETTVYGGENAVISHTTLIDDDSVGSSHQIVDSDYTMETDNCGYKLKVQFDHADGGTSHVHGFKVKYHLADS